MTLCEARGTQQALDLFESPLFHIAYYAMNSLKGSRNIESFFCTPCTDKLFVRKNPEILLPVCIIHCNTSDLKEAAANKVESGARGNFDICLHMFNTRFSCSEKILARMAPTVT